MATVVLPKPEPSPDETLSDIKGFVEDVNDTLKSDKRAKRKADKEQLDVTERMSENMEWFGSMYEQTNTGKKAKLRDKLSEGWTKVFKNKWFEGIFGFMRRMSLGGIGDFLGLLLGIFVLIQTGLLDVLIPILINMAQVLITAIIKYLPRFIKFLIHILKDVLPPFFETIFNTILDAVGVDKNSPLRKLVKPLSKILPWLLAFGLLIGKFLPMIMTAVRFLQPVISGLLKFLPHIGKLLAGLNPVGIVAIIIAAVWIFAEEIVKVYDWIIEKVFDLVFSFFPSLKPFKDVIVTMAKAFLMLTPNIYSLARLFANIKKLGFLEGIKKTIKEFLGSFFELSGAILEFFGILSPAETKKAVGDAKNIIFGLLGKIGSFFSEIFSPIWEDLKSIGSELGTIFSDLFSEIKSIFSGLFSSNSQETATSFKDTIAKIMGVFSTFFKLLKPFAKIFGKIFVVQFKILAVMIKALIAPFRFFVFIVEKLVKGFSKLKNIFSGKGFIKTMSEIGTTVKDMIMGAFTKAKTIFEDAMIGLMEILLSLVDNLSFRIKNIVKLGAEERKYGIESAEVYAEEAKYIRKVSRKTGQSEGYLHKIARGEVSISSKDSVAMQDFAKAIRDLRSKKSEDKQLEYLKEIADKIEGNKHASNSININTGGTLTDPTLKNYNSATTMTG